MNDFFQLSIEGGIAHLQLNRPERMNTMAPVFFPAFRDAVQALSDQGAARVLVISSTGKHFSAGMALDTFGGDGALLDTSTSRARLSFQDGLRKLMGCFDVLDAQRSLFAAQQALVQTQALQLQNMVTLYKVLGGGWTQPAN